MLRSHLEAAHFVTTDSTDFHGSHFTKSMIIKSKEIRSTKTFLRFAINKYGSYLRAKTFTISTFVQQSSLFIDIYYSKWAKQHYDYHLVNLFE